MTKKKPVVLELPFDKAFAVAIAEGMQYADALEQYVTGKNKIRRAACIQTLQAISALTLEDVHGLLMWARSQEY